MPDPARLSSSRSYNKGGKTTKPGRALKWLSLAFLIFMVIGSSCTADSAGFELIVIAPDLDDELLRLEVEPGDRFSLAYIHSVTGREVKGTFEITFEGRLLPLTTEYDSFGPGLPELDARQNYDIVNGIITFYHNEAPRDQLGLFVSPLTKERLFVFDQEYDLTSGQESALLVHIYIAP